jgi:BirA family biotin operon repressor/biotin-[acetyl-CoA-carboxylase] ligase
MNAPAEVRGSAPTDLRLPEHGPLAASPSARGTGTSAEFEQVLVSGWVVRRYGAVASTQDVAAQLPGWTAVIAASQAAGRGQWQRSFTSDPGGLYLTAVLPFEGGGASWRGFALVAGLAIATRLGALGIAALRLRWPNDLMIGDRKVGGLLVSQGRRDTLCVGLGLNVHNRPWLLERSLEATACRLADFAREDQLGLDSLTGALLGAIRQANENFQLRGLSGCVDELNQCWGGARDVRLELAEGAPTRELSGLFQGILSNGDLRLQVSSGGSVVVRSHWVKRLEEC